MFRLRCFGQVAIEDGDGGEVHLRSRKHVALLLYLLAHQERAYPRERLARLFWDSERHLARHSLSQALYDIRTKLPAVELKRTSTSVGIGGNSFVYDARAFEEAVRANDLGRAVSLYEGEFAPDLDDAGLMDFERWIESERGRLRRLAEIVLCRRVRECDERAEWGEMCVSALRLLDMNPLLEEAHRALMRGLWLQGDRLAALHHYEKSEEFLERELPGGPSRETLELVERIRSSRPTGRQPVRVIERPEAEMVGREEPFRTLQRALRSVIEEGDGRLVRIWGEAGVGKTRLVEEFQRIAALEPVRVLESRCHAAESEVPYGPVVDGLSGLASEFSARMSEDEAYYQLGHLFPSDFPRPEPGGDADFTEPGAGRRRLYEETADLLRQACAEASVVWVVEDVHWGDSSSASLLRYLSKRLSHHPFLLIVTARTHEDIGSGPLALLEELRPSESGVVEVELRPLDPGEIGRLVASLHGEPLDDATVRKVHKLAGGNPFYTQEIVRTLGSGDGEGSTPVLEAPGEALITDSLRALLERRMRSLDRDAIQLMRAVAVAGRHATPGVVRDVLGISGAKLSETSIPLYASGLLDDSGDSLDFFHDITREFVYGRMSEMQRSGMHSAVGRALEEGDLDVDPSTLAHHFHQGQDPARAYRYALEAAREAEDRYAHEEAIQMAELALEHASDEDQRIDALEVLAEAEMAIARYPEAIRHLQEIRTIQQGKGEADAWLLPKIARAHIELGDWSAGHDAASLVDIPGLIQSGIDRNDSELILRTLHLHLKAALHAGEMEEARSVDAKISDMLRRFRENDCITDASNAIGYCSKAALAIYDGSRIEAKSFIKQTDQLIPRLPTDLQLKCLVLRAIVGLLNAEWDEANLYLERLINLASEYNDIVYSINAYTNILYMAVLRSDWRRVSEVDAVLQPVLEAVPDRLVCRHTPRLNVADSYFYQHNYNRALSVYMDIISSAKNTDVHNLDSVVIWDARAGSGLCLLAKRKLESVSEQLQQIDLGADSAHFGVSDRYRIVWLKEVMRWLSSPEEAETRLKEVGKLEAKRNLVGGLRLQWLGEALRQERMGQDSSAIRCVELQEKLKQTDNYWFPGFVRRWLRRVTDGLKKVGGSW